MPLHSEVSSPARLPMLTAIAALGAISWTVALPPPLAAQEMGFEEYAPRSTLRVPESPVTRARFPFVDVHNHLRGELTPERVDSIVARMDALNMAVFVNLSGGSGERLEGTVRALSRHPERFVVFANPSYEGIDDPDYAERTAAQFEADVRSGARGLKIFKNLGMYVSTRRAAAFPWTTPAWTRSGPRRVSWAFPC